MSNSWNKKEMLKQIDNYFKNIPEEEIINDIIEACRGQEGYNHMIENINEGE